MLSEKVGSSRQFNVVESLLFEFDKDPDSKVLIEALAEFINKNSIIRHGFMNFAKSAYDKNPNGISVNEILISYLQSLRGEYGEENAVYKLVVNFIKEHLNLVKREVGVEAGLLPSVNDSTSKIPSSRPTEVPQEIGNTFGEVMKILGKK